jgi:hypothetical protein
MARLSDEELDDIISRDLPVHRIVRRKGDEAEAADADVSTATEADEVSPDLDELRRKYLGGGGSDAPDRTPAEAAAAPAGEVPAGAKADESADDDDDEIVIVEKEASADPLGHRARPKAVVVSSKEGRVVGYQG